MLRQKPRQPLRGHKTSDNIGPFYEINKEAYRGLAVLARPKDYEAVKPEEMRWIKKQGTEMRRYGFPKILRHQISILVLLLVTSCQADVLDIEGEITGNWYRSPKPTNTTEKEFSWGLGETVLNFTLEIDAVSENPTIFLPMIGGPFPITSVIENQDGTAKLTFFFDRGGFDVSYLIHFEEERNVFWLELATAKDLSLLPTGEDFRWFRISGP